jgi:hypothetical protein
VSHACNPSYSGGRDQEDHGSKPAWANGSQDPIPTKNKISQKRVGGIAHGIGPKKQNKRINKKQECFFFKLKFCLFITGT